MNEEISDSAVLVGTVQCEVLSITADRVYVRIRGAGGWIMERSFDLQFCPEVARGMGGVFLIHTYERQVSGSKEYSMRAEPVDATAEAEILERVF